MKIIYSFKQNTYQYDCSACNGICCNICGKLKITRNQLLMKDFLKYVEFCEKEKDHYLISIPKKCWFIKNSKCILGDSKPLCCKLYPVEMYKLYNLAIIAEIMPCPTMKIGSSGICNVDEDIEKYSEEFDIPNHALCSIISINKKVDLEKIIERKEKIMIKYMNSSSLILSLFSQLLFYPPMLFLDDNQLEDIYIIYTNSYNKLKTEFDNEMNLYIYLRSKCIRYVLKEYYIPLNPLSKVFEANLRDERVKWIKK